MTITKNKVICCLIAILILLLNLLSFYTKKANEEGALAIKLEQSLTDYQKQAEITTIALNDSLKVKEASIKNLAVTNKVLNDKYGDLLNASKVKPKEVLSLNSIGTITFGRDTVYCQVDSFGGLKAELVDQYANIKVAVDKQRKAVIDYSVKDSITIINYQKKHSILFGLIKWNSYSGCKVVSHNPKSTPATLISYSTLDK